MGIIIKNKRGMFFTLMAIIVLSLFFMSYGYYSYHEDRKTVKNRIETMNNFIFSMEKDLERQIYISGFRIIFLFEKNIIDSGKPIVNFSLTVNECFLNSSIYGVNQPLMDDARFSYLQETLLSRGEKINLDINLFSPSITISQDDPWNVKIIFVSNLIIEDYNNMASWNKTITIISYVPIEFFEDPLYLLNTNAQVTNKINRTRYIPFTSSNDVANLSIHSKNSLYINSSIAPSFLDRLQGINNQSPYGIESLVNLEKLSSMGIIVKDKTCVDYIYFSLDNPTSYRVQGMDSWFKIDDNHLEIYNVRGITI